MVDEFERAAMVVRFFFHHGVDAITLSEYRHTDVGFYVAIMDN